MVTLLSLSEIFAHQVTSVSVVSLFDSQKHSYTVEAAMEVIPSADPKLNEQISPEDAARDFVKFLVLLFDAEQQQPEIQISLTRASDSETPDELQRHQVITRLRGEIPKQAKEFLLYVEPDCPMAVVMAVDLDGVSGRLQVVLAGEYSLPVNLRQATEAVQKTDRSASAARSENQSGAIPSSKEDFRSNWMTALTPFPLPSLLILSLLLLAEDRRELLWFSGLLFLGTSLTLICSALLSSYNLLSIGGREAEIQLTVVVGIVGIFTFAPLGRSRAQGLSVIFIISGLVLGSSLWAINATLPPASIALGSFGRILLIEMGIFVRLLISLILITLLRSLLRDPARWRILTRSLATLVTGYMLFYLTGLL